MRQDIINLWILTKAIGRELGERETLESFLETIAKKEYFLREFNGDKESLKEYARKVIEEYEKEKLEEEE